MVRFANHPPTASADPPHAARGGRETRGAHIGAIPTNHPEDLR
jgi:hypothetical protein